MNVTSWSEEENVSKYELRLQRFQSLDEKGFTVTYSYLVFAYSQFSARRHNWIEPYFYFTVQSTQQQSASHPTPEACTSEWTLIDDLNVKPFLSSINRLSSIWVTRWSSKDKAVEAAFGNGCESDNLFFELACTLHARFENPDKHLNVRYEASLKL